MTLVAPDGSGWTATWLNWYVSADGAKVPCTWKIYGPEGRKLPFYSWCEMGHSRSVMRVMSRPAKGGDWEQVPQHPGRGGS